MENIAKNIEIIVDNDPSHERNEFMRKAINFFLIPILNRLPRGFFVKSGRRAKTVHERATTHKALEVIYSFDNQLNFEKGILDGFMAYFWLKTNNAKALRNRLKLVKKELIKSINSFNNKKIIKILNLACGSNRAVIEVIGEYKNNFDFKVFGVDKNQLAIEDAQKLCGIFDIIHLTKWHQDTVSGFLLKNKFKFDIIEMVGFLDYVEDVKAIALFDKIYFTLNKGGFFITGNIKDNPERKFITEVVGWPSLIFRNESDLIRLLMNSKFKSSNIKITYEPHNIHGVITCKK